MDTKTTPTDWVELSLMLFKYKGMISSFKKKIQKKKKPLSFVEGPLGSARLSQDSCRKLSSIQISSGP